jgi:hypothetical protein
MGAACDLGMWSLAQGRLLRSFEGKEKVVFGKCITPTHEVVPAQAGIHSILLLLRGLTTKNKIKMDPSLRWDDDDDGGVTIAAASRSALR